MLIAWGGYLFLGVFDPKRRTNWKRRKNWWSQNRANENAVQLGCFSQALLSLVLILFGVSLITILFAQNWASQIFNATLYLLFLLVFANIYDHLSSKDR